MLQSLSIRNFAVVSELKIDFGPGLSVFTGETGAGKSILIEALGFLLGARASTDWLREGAPRLVVEGAFQMKDGVRIIRRELDAAGKTRSAINGKPVSVAALSQFGDSLVDFHGQHEHQTLLKPAFQLEVLDAYAGLSASRIKLSELYATWTKIQAELDSARMSDEERLRRLEYDRFQLGEIDAAKLHAGVEEELEAELPLLKNADRIRALADTAYGWLYAKEGAVIENLLKAGKAVEDLCRYDESLSASRDSLESARLAVEDTARTLGDLRGRAACDPAKLDDLLSRQDKISRLKKKHGATVADILARREALAEEIVRLENSQQRIEDLELALEDSRKSLSAACGRIHKARCVAAKKLDGAFLRELKALGMPHARFGASVEMEEDRFTATGSDEVEFLIAPNPGESLKPLRSTASGGELSRVMLALKTVFADLDRVPVLVFDEIDTGIGGTVARAVGEKLAALGKGRQVLCVTHLAQVACFAPRHFHVRKEIDAGRTLVRVETLEGERRLEAVASMLGGRAPTEASRKHAQELLESSIL